MLAAVNCGRSQSPSLVLSRRRSMRRLRLASLRCKVAFTRNPSGLRVLETLDTLSNPGKAERFRVFHGISPPTSGEFAWFRPSKALYWYEVRGRKPGAGAKSIGKTKASAVLVE